MRSWLVSLLLLSCVSARAELIHPALNCAALLASEAEDPGPQYAHRIFKGLSREWWRNLTKNLRFDEVMLFVPSPSSILDDGAVDLTDKQRDHVFQIPGLLRPYTTAVNRWTTAAKRALKKASSVKRTRVVGADRIRTHLEERAARVIELQRRYEAAPVRPVPSRGAMLLEDASDLGLHGFGMVLGSLAALRGFERANYGIATIGAAVALAMLPMIKVTLERIFVYGKQAAMRKGWIEGVETPAAARVDEATFRKNVFVALEENDPSAFVYRGTEAHVERERFGPAIPALNPVTLDEAHALEAMTIAAKGHPPLARRVQISHDEVLVFDEEVRDWVLVGVAYAR